MITLFTLATVAPIILGTLTIAIASLRPDGPYDVPERAPSFAEYSLRCDREAIIRTESLIRASRVVHGMSVRPVPSPNRPTWDADAEDGFDIAPDTDHGEG